MLQSSLSRPPSLPHVDDDGDEEMEIDEEGVEDHLVVLHNSDGGSAGFSAPDASIDSPSASMNCDSPPNLSVAQCNSSPILKSPTPSVSPTITSSRKSLRTSSRLSPSENILQGESDRGTKTVDRKSLCIGFSSKTAPNFLTKTENLAASIRHGLEIIDGQHCSAALRQSSLRLSLKPSEPKLIVPINKVDVGVQTFLDDNAREQDSVVFDCNNCKSRMQLDVIEIDDGSNMQLVPVHCPESADKLKKQILKVCIRITAAFCQLA